MRFTDTAANWDLTVEHCANVKYEPDVENNGIITKTFAVWSAAEINTVTFYRPNSLDIPDPERQYGLLDADDTVRPSDSQPVDCANNAVDPLDDDSDNDTIPDTDPEPAQPEDNTASNAAALTGANTCEQFE